jgi:hypothetical protein
MYGASMELNEASFTVGVWDGNRQYRWHVRYVAAHSTTRFGNKECDPQTIDACDPYEINESCKVCANVLWISCRSFQPKLLMSYGAHYVATWTHSMQETKICWSLHCCMYASFHVPLHASRILVGTKSLQCFDPHCLPEFLQP